MIGRVYLLHSTYAPQVQPFRLALSENNVWRFLDKPDPPVLQLFLIEYCALGVAMTEPVGRWRRRAGQRCQQLGLGDIGEFLLAHADEEKDHHMAFIKDTQWLVNHWNTTHDRQLDAEALLAQPLPPGVLAYRSLHESIVDGDAPYCQLAIEFEIDRLSTTYGAAALPKIVSVFGGETIKGLQFLDNRVRQGAWHTSRVERVLNDVLEQVPASLTALTKTAGLALKAYGQYLTDCLALAERQRRHESDKER